MLCNNGSNIFAILYECVHYVEDISEWVTKAAFVNRSCSRFRKNTILKREKIQVCSV
jgi:hypothetical protein